MRALAHAAARRFHRGVVLYTGTEVVPFGPRLHAMPIEALWRWRARPAATICRDKDGNPEPDPELRDTESVPLAESVQTFFEREVSPHVPDASIDTAKRDEKDGEVGIVGYEINFNRYFYRYTPPRPLEEIEADIRGIETDILRMLAEVSGSTS